MMNTFENWEIESPKQINLFMSELTDGFNGVKISLSNIENSQLLIEIYFPSVLIYTVSEESGRIKFLYDNETIGVFNKAKKSTFMEWFNDQSRNFYNSDKIYHYNIVSLNKIIDVISDQIPNVRYI